MVMFILYYLYSTSGRLKEAVRNDHHVGILLANGIVAWHWILGVGYRNYTSSSDLYLRIVDGWNNNANRFYKPNSNSLWVSSTEYWVE